MKKIFSVTAVLFLCVLCLTACSSQIHTSGKSASSIIDTNTGELISNNVEQDEVQQTALTLAIAWRDSCFQDSNAWGQFISLSNSAEKSLGADNALAKLLSLAAKDGLYSSDIEMPTEYSSPVTWIDVDSFINILTFDKMGKQSEFLDEYIYVSDDFRFENSLIRPVYDLYNFTYGLYNVETKEYIYEPSISYLPAPDEYGYICLRYEGYYGCIDLTGEKVIGFMYDEPITFEENGLAVVKTNKKYGVINAAGADILPTKFGYIRLFDHVIAANINTLKPGEHESAEFALFSQDGSQITPHNYCDVIPYNNRLYVEYNRDARLDDLYNQTWYDLYDDMGNRLIGSGTSVPEVWGVKLPGGNGTMFAVCGGKTVNEYGVQYPFDIGSLGIYIYLYGCRYVTEDLKWLNTSVYDSGYYDSDIDMCSFNENGYAVASFRTPNGKDVRVVLNANGNEVERFTQSENGYWPIAANDYIYQMAYCDPYVDYVQRGVLNRKTRDFTAYSSVQMIDGTNLAIVKDADTGLFGLYDRDSLVLDLVYNEIEYSWGEIIATRGAEERVYTPIDQSLDNLDTIIDTDIEEIMINAIEQYFSAK